MNMAFTRFIVKATKPIHLLGGVLVFALGVSIARYLGNTIDWALVVLGQVWITTYQLGSHCLQAYFQTPIDPRNPDKIQVEREDDEPEVQIRRDSILWTSLAAFAAMTSFTLLIIQSRVVGFPALVLMAMIMIGGILYSVPPFTLELSGYGELLQSIIMASMIPGLGYVLQSGDLHRLVALSTFPLIMLYLGMILVHLLEKFPDDMRKNRRTFLVRFGWERSIALHNFLILGYFLFHGLSMVFGLPFSIGLPVFTVLPLALFQVWYINRIIAGAKPNWRIINLTAVFTFSLPVYLLVFRFLIH